MVIELQVLHEVASTQESQYVKQALQTLGAPTQKNPVSSTHIEEHPSPFIVLLSSHAKPLITNPSPQIAKQRLLETSIL